MATATTTRELFLVTEYPTEDDTQSGDDIGASGDQSGSTVSLSTGGMVAIIVVCSIVIICGISTAILFYQAKKREWTVKETIRRSARRVATALTPRRSEFPSSVKGPPSSSSRRFRSRIADDVPPTPRVKPEDLEKGRAQAEAKRKEWKWPK